MSSFLSIKHKKNAPDSARNALVAMLISLVPIIGLGSLIVSGRDIPPIHNISTDVVDPPVFVKVSELRSSQHNPLEYDAESTAALQQAAYPNIKTLKVNMNIDQAHARALELVGELGWDIVNDDPAKNLIEASHSTPLWKFTDDIVIRLRPNQTDDQVLIDLRSVSRVGRSDLGANAKRIEKFITSF